MPPTQDVPVRPAPGPGTTETTGGARGRQEAPSPGAVDTRQDNANERDGGLGALCWARWELDRNLLDSLEAPDRAGRNLSELERYMPEVVASLDEAAGDLPGAVEQFRAGLKMDTEASATLFPLYRDEPDVLLEALVAVFDFEGYPGHQEYTELAVEHPSCSQP